jgi:hypothetical protein
VHGCQLSLVLLGTCTLLLEPWYSTLSLVRSKKSRTYFDDEEYVLSATGSLSYTQGRLELLGWSAAYEHLICSFLSACSLFKIYTTQCQCSTTLSSISRLLSSIVSSAVTTSMRHRAGVSTYALTPVHYRRTLIPS